METQTGQTQSIEEIFVSDFHLNKEVLGKKRYSCCQKD